MNYEYVLHFNIEEPIEKSFVFTLFKMLSFKEIAFPLNVHWTKHKKKGFLEDYKFVEYDSLAQMKAIPDLDQHWDDSTVIIYLNPKVKLCFSFFNESSKIDIYFQESLFSQQVLGYEWLKKFIQQMVSLLPVDLARVYPSNYDIYEQEYFFSTLKGFESFAFDWMTYYGRLRLIYGLGKRLNQVKSHYEKIELTQGTFISIQEEPFKLNNHEHLERRQQIRDEFGYHEIVTFNRDSVQLDIISMSLTNIRLRRVISSGELDFFPKVFPKELERAKTYLKACKELADRIKIPVTLEWEVRDRVLGSAIQDMFIKNDLTEIYTLIEDRETLYSFRLDIGEKISISFIFALFDILALSESFFPIKMCWMTNTEEFDELIWLGNEGKLKIAEYKYTSLDEIKASADINLFKYGKTLSFRTENGITLNVNFRESNHEISFIINGRLFSEKVLDYAWIKKVILDIDSHLHVDSARIELLREFTPFHPKIIRFHPNSFFWIEYYSQSILDDEFKRRLKQVKSCYEWIESERGIFISIQEEPFMTDNPQHLEKREKMRQEFGYYEVLRFIRGRVRLNVTAISDTAITLRNVFDINQINRFKSGYDHWDETDKSSWLAYRLADAREDLKACKNLAEQLKIPVTLEWEVQHKALGEALRELFLANGLENVVLVMISE
jgi:hypothetical protein